MILTVKSYEETTAFISIESNGSGSKICTPIYYKIGSGSWKTFSSRTDHWTTNMAGTITGLTAGETNTITVKVAYESVGSAIASDVTKSTTVTTYGYPYCTSAPNFTIGSAATLKFYNPLGRLFTFRFMLTGGTILATGTLQSTSYTGLNGSTTINNFYSAVTTAKYAKYWIQCEYDGHTTVQSINGNTCYCKESDCIPTIGSVVYADVNSTTTAVTGNDQYIVQNKSRLQITASSLAAKKSATLTRCYLDLNGSTYTMNLSGSTATYSRVFDLAQSMKATVRLRDSRGYEATKSVTVAFKAYSAPAIYVSRYRENGYYSNTTITPTATYTQIGSNTIGNISMSAVSGSTTITSTFTSGQTQTISLANTKTWTLTFTVTDSFGTTTTKTVKIGKGTPIWFLDVEKLSVGVNRFPTHDNSLEVNGSIYIPHSEIQGSTPVYKGLYGVDDVNVEYPMVIDNGDNLWFGAEKAAARHHVGGTYISSGYDSTNSKGYTSVRVSVPDSSNSSAANYWAIHSGMIARGRISGTSVSASSYTDVTVTFSHSFESAPNVVCCLDTDSTSGAIGSLSVAVLTGSISTTGFTARIFNSGSSARTPGVQWIAIGGY